MCCIGVLYAIFVIKAAKRAFDTVIAVAEEVRPGETNIDKCVASGASKVMPVVQFGVNLKLIYSVECAAINMK